MTKLSKWMLAGAMMLATVPLLAADEVAPTERDGEKRAAIEDAKLHELFAGSVSVYLEGNVAVPFLTDGTFQQRVRIADKEYMLFTTGKENDRVLIRTQTIAAVRIRLPK